MQTRRLVVGWVVLLLSSCGSDGSHTGLFDAASTDGANDASLDARLDGAAIDTLAGTDAASADAAAADASADAANADSGVADAAPVDAGADAPGVDAATGDAATGVDAAGSIDGAAELVTLCTAGGDECGPTRVCNVAICDPDVPGSGFCIPLDPLTCGGHPGSPCPEGLGYVCLFQGSCVLDFPGVCVKADERDFICDKQPDLWNCE